MSTFRILLADDHPIFRLGLCSLLESHDGWKVCGQAIDGRDAVEKCMNLKPDLAILDICMPTLNGADAAAQILKDNPTQKILILTDVDSEKVIRNCLEAGVRGWIFKSDGTDEVTRAVESLQRNNSSFSPRVSDLLMRGYLERPHAGPTPAKVPRLSPREREVLQLVAESKTSREVGVILNISAKTAETHRSNLMTKLRLHSIAELVLYAVRNEIVHVQIPVINALAERGNGLATLARNLN
ncbi:MAG TPA: response regulator transcription factor [Candidatus Sulfotelmatobacter sp.]